MHNSGLIIVWFEEPVPMIETAVPMVEQADIFVVVGAWLVVTAPQAW